MERTIRYLLFFCITLWIASCAKDDDYSLSKFWVSSATITTEDVKPFLIITDNGDRLFPSASQIMNFKPNNGQRVWVSYTILGDGEDEFDHYVRINDVRDILTKEIIELTAENEDSIGNDPVTIESVWFSGDFLTVGFIYGGGGTIHYINLVRNADSTHTESGVPILEFRHNKNNDLYNNAMRGWVSFDLSELKVDDQDSVRFILRSKEFDGQQPFEKELIYKYSIVVD